MLSPEKVKELIVAESGFSDVQIIPRGDSTYSGLKRFLITAMYRGIRISFAHGENLVFAIDKEPHHMMPHLPLVPDDKPAAFVQACLRELEHDLKDKPPTIKKSLAKKYLGPFESTIRKTHTIYVYYDVFYLVISSKMILVVRKENNFAERAWIFKNEKGKSMGDIFASIKAFTDSLRIRIKREKVKKK